MSSASDAASTRTLAVALFFAALIYTVPARAGECGKASFYAEQHQGKTMANGRPFDMHAMTAASWYYPLGTKVRVSAGGRSVVVTITDRGPAKRLGRIIDLSKAAFAKLAPVGQGVIRACVAR